MDEPTTRGEIPGDLQGQIDLLEADGSPQSKIAADVYREVLDGKLPLEQARDAVLERELIAGY